MSEHVLKIHEQPFNGLLSGEKTAEIRNNDRGFQVGDTVRLREIYDGSEAFTGREMRRLITHVQTDYGLPDNRCVLSYAPDIDARKAGQGEAVEVMCFQLKHPISGESHTVDFTHKEVAEGMEDALYEKLGALICECQSVGETNVVDCNCDEYIYDFELQPDTAPPATADAVSVPRELLERLADMLVNPIHYNPGAIDKRAEELRALLARQEVKP